MKATSQAERLTPSSKRYKLKECTWTLGSTKVRYDLLWCDRVPKGKRNKPCKKNGVMYSETCDAVEHTYYVPVQ